MSLRRPGQDAHGQGLVEFALILPVFLLVLMGVFDFGRMLYAYNAISNAAREGARTAIVDQSQSGGVYAAETEAADQATALGLDASDDNQVRLTFETTAGAACATRDVGCLAVMRVRYLFTPITPIVGNIVGPIQLETTTKMPIERTTP